MIYPTLYAGLIIYSFVKIYQGYNHKSTFAFLYIRYFFAGLFLILALGGLCAIISYPLALKQQLTGYGVPKSILNTITSNLMYMEVGFSVGSAIAIGNIVLCKTMGTALKYYDTGIYLKLLGRVAPEATYAKVEPANISDSRRTF